jgi:hypothetical protein
MLLKNGVPFDVAESWSDDERNAYFIIFSEMESGASFNFTTQTYESPT